MDNPHLTNLNLRVDGINGGIPGVVPTRGNTQLELIILDIVNYFLDICDKLGVKTYAK